MTRDSKQAVADSRLLFGVLNRDLKLLFMCNLTGAFGDGLYAYLLPLYLSDNLKADSVQIGILYAIVSLLAAFSLLLAGMLADKYDRKKIMIAGWIAWIPAPLIFSVASNWFQAVPGMILWGIWLGGPTTTAYIVTTGNRSKLTLTFTLISAAWSLGYVFSPALGGYLAGALGMQSVFYLASILYTIACLSLVFIRSQKKVSNSDSFSQGGPPFLSLLRNRKLIKLAVFFASVMFVLMMYRPFVPQFLAKVHQYSELEIGILGSACFSGSAILGILLGRLGDRWRKSYAVAASMMACCVSALVLILSNSFPILFVTFFLAGGSYIAWSLMGAVVGSLAPEQGRARWISVPQTISMFSSFVAPYLGGVLYNMSPSYPLVGATVATAIIALIALVGLPER